METDELQPFDPEVDVELAEDPEGAAGEGQSASPAEPAAPSGPPQFNYNQRLYAFGFTGTGKSEILNLLFSGAQCQRLMIDNKPEFAIRSLDGDGYVTPVHDPEAVDWREPLIHYQPRPGSDCSQYEEIFAAAFLRRGVLILVHEWGALVDYQPNKAGRYVVSYVAQGERLGLGLLAGSTRPKLIPSAGITEASHLLVFGANFSKREDVDAAAEALSPVHGRPLSSHELAAELGAHHQEHGEHGFLWKERRTGILHALPPLPDHLRHLSIVDRLEDA